MTNSKTIAKTKENRLNQNGSLSKTDQRKLKPISFCLLDTEQVTMLEKIEKFQYGNFFKNIIASMTDEEVEQIANSNKKSDPIIPQKLLDLNITKGFLSCRSIAKVLFKHNKVERQDKKPFVMFRSNHSSKITRSKHHKRFLILSFNCKGAF